MTRKLDTMPHMRQLDGLRAFAIAAVFIAHFVPKQSVLFKLAPWGQIGVRLFFVLSGFLITGILLNGRSYADGGQSRVLTARQFYIRRMLRIAPIFYLVIALGWLLNLYPFRETTGWHVSYLSNFLFATQPHYFRSAAAHLWSLAVEEQFYLVWPLVILLLSDRLLPKVAIGSVVLAIAYRCTAFWLQWDDLSVTLVPIACLDTLALGALLAMVRHMPRLSHWKNLLSGCAIAGLLLLVALYLLRTVGLHRGAQLILSDTALALVCVWIVDRAATGFGGAIGRVLSCTPVGYIGRISYGLYLYHALLIPVYGHSEFATHLPALVNALLMTIMAIGIAALSWHLLEKPINDLKRFAPYHIERSRQGSQTTITAAPLVAAQREG